MNLQEDGNNVAHTANDWANRNIKIWAVYKMLAYHLNKISDTQKKISEIKSKKWKMK